MRRSVRDKTKCLFCYVPSLCLLLINGWKKDTGKFRNIFSYNVGRVIGVISLQNMLRIKLSYVIGRAERERGL